MFPGRLDFVVADPDHNARVIAQPCDVVAGLLPDVFQKPRIARIHAATEHEVLPDENSHFVAEVIEVITLINASAPNAQHVHVGVAH